MPIELPSPYCSDAAEMPAITPYCVLLSSECVSNVAVLPQCKIAQILHNSLTPYPSLGGAHQTFGAYFPDLASNMLGSFIMGVLTSASALKSESARAVAILPEDHAWQVKLP